MAVLPPILESSAGVELSARGGQEISFTVTASHAPGKHLDLVLLNPPRGSVFTPARNATGTVARRLRWVPLWGGPQRLIFEARDTNDRSVRSQLIVRVDVLDGSYRKNVLSGDVTGDGQVDLVVGAQFATVHGVDEAGTVLVFRGGRKANKNKPSATLRVPGAAPEDRLTNTLREHFSGQGSQGLFLEDVTGDGILDVVAVATLADVNGVENCGAAYVWKGGPNLGGFVAPTATLTRPSPNADDHLGEVDLHSDETPVLFHDVTGNGIRDILIKCERADIGGVMDAGAVFLWEGGASLVGEPAIKARLALPTRFANDRMSGGGAIPGVYVEDLDLDGIRDVLVLSAEATVDAVSAVGAVHLWKGGPGLSGTPAPQAWFTVPGAAAGDSLGSAFLDLADITGDGFRDLIVVSEGVDVGGVVNAGAGYVFGGGLPLAGAQVPIATLIIPGALAEDRLGSAEPGVHIADLTGDGIPDLYAATPFADLGGVQDAGAGYVFAGGVGITGTVSPIATLTRPSVSVSDYFGGGVFSPRSPEATFADFTGDGVIDLVAGSTRIDVAGEEDAGAMFLWHGGAGLTGSKPPDVSLAVTPHKDDRLGELSAQDVTGDGQVDLIISAVDSDAAGLDYGAVFVWAGGATLATPGSAVPTATLSVPGSFAGDRLTEMGVEKGLLFADVTGDEVLDIVAGSSFADVIPHANQGAIHLWAGGPGMSGSPSPSTTLLVDGASNQDLLAYRSSILFADLSGDGVLDVVTAAESADIGLTRDCGSAYVWYGGSHLSPGVVHQSLWFRQRPIHRSEFDRLGEVDDATGLHFTDHNGDGHLELLVGASDVNVDSSFDAGAVLLFDPLLNDRFPTLRFTRNNPSSYDYLGR